MHASDRTWRTSVPATAVSLVIAVLAGASIVMPARATTYERLERTRGEIEALTRRIESRAVALSSARETLARIDGEIRGASERMADLQGDRARFRERLAVVQARYDAAQELLSAAVSQAFMDAGPGSADIGVLGAVLGSSDIGEVADRAVYASAAGEEAVRLAEGVDGLRDELAARSAGLDALVSREAGIVDDLERLRAEQEAVAAAEAEAAAALDAARDEAIATVQRLEGRLFGVGGLDLSGVGAALHGEQRVTYGRWAELFLRMFGAPVCRSNLVVVVAWQAAEGTQAAWNPLATTHRMPGSTSFNSVGVQDFVSLEQGLLGTKETIENGWDMYRYGAIVRALQGCSDPVVTALAINASSWCPGCVSGQYVLNVVPRVDEDLEAYLKI